MQETFYIKVYGCQMNVYDAKNIIGTMERHGFVRTIDPKSADILILYTCNIRENAARKVFSAIGMLKSNRTKVVAIGGCVAQAEKEEIFKKSKIVNIVFGPHVYHKLPDYIHLILNGEQSKIIDVSIEKFNKFKETQDKNNNVSFSEFVTIQEGCDNFCSYCVVPYTRGREYSRAAKDIILDIKRLIANGTKEIILLGQNVNSYNGEAAYINIGASSNWKLDRLLYEIAGIDGIKRLRYTTSHPKDMTVDLMMAHAKITVLAPFAHVPIQSGSDRILKLMNRGYTAIEYLDKLKTFQTVCPSMQFSSDFIVGFPTETLEDFGATVQIANVVKYTVSYAFKYSRRDSTLASKMDGQIPEHEKESRLEVLQNSLSQHQISRNNSLIGQVQWVLFDKCGKRKNQYIGKNAYMQSVVVECETNLIGEFKDILIESAGMNSVYGKVL